MAYGFQLLPALSSGSTGFRNQPALCVASHLFSHVSGALAEIFLKC